MLLANKVAIVTGAGGKGSGRAIAQRFAREGAAVVVSDIDESGGVETVAGIETGGGKAAFVAANVRREEDIRSLIAFALDRFDRLDVLVNNASGPGFYPDQPLDYWEALIETDLMGPIRATRLAIDAMRKTGGGAIVNVSSTSALAHGRIKGKGSPGYDVAKAGVLRLTTMLGFLGETERIRVNCIAPDWIAVPELQAYFNSLTPEQRREAGVPSRLTTLDEIAAAVLRLATDETLAGRVLVWWSDEEPGLIAWGDPGYGPLTDWNT